MAVSEYLTSLFGLSGRVAVVIGGTGELCGAMAQGLASAGAEIVLVGRDAAKAEARLKKIADAGGKCRFVPADVTSRADLEKVRDDVHERSGRIDIVVNGAGVNSATPFFEISDEEFQRLVDVNQRAVFVGCQIFGKYLVEQGRGGSIINVGSMTGVIPLSRVFTYSMTKASVHNLGKNLAREWAPAGVRVNTLVPGFFPAEQNRKVLTDERKAAILNHTPMRRFGEARELIGATLLLASDAAGSFITGEELLVDGGYAAMTI